MQQIILYLTSFMKFPTNPGLFNLRGSDIPFNPVFMSYAIVTLDNVR